MLPADDVIDLMRKRSVILMKQTILTPEHRPSNYFGA